MTKHVQEIAESDLDQVTGADSNHKKWISIESMSQSIHRPGSGAAQSDTMPVEELSLNYEEVKWT